MHLEADLRSHLCIDLKNLVVQSQTDLDLGISHLIPLNIYLLNVRRVFSKQHILSLE